MAPYVHTIVFGRRSSKADIVRLIISVSFSELEASPCCAKGARAGERGRARKYQVCFAIPPRDWVADSCILGKSGHRS